MVNPPLTLLQSQALAYCRITAKNRSGRGPSLVETMAHLKSLTGKDRDFISNELHALVDSNHIIIDDKEMRNWIDHDFLFLNVCEASYANTPMDASYANTPMEALILWLLAMPFFGIFLLSFYDMKGQYLKDRSPLQPRSREARLLKLRYGASILNCLVESLIASVIEPIMYRAAQLAPASTGMPNRDVLLLMMGVALACMIAGVVIASR